jgi:hypothetical protein
MTRGTISKVAANEVNYWRWRVLARGTECKENIQYMRLINEEVNNCRHKLCFLEVTLPHFGRKCVRRRGDYEKELK